MKNKKLNIILVFALFLLVILIDVNAIGLQIKNKILIQSTLDFSWKLDLVERFFHGYLAGRDFVFTYGPLFQLFAGLPKLLLPISSSSSLLYSSLVSSSLVFLLLLGISRLFFKQEKTGLFLFYMLFIVGLAAFYLIDMIRMLLPLFYAALVAFLYSKKSWRQLLISSAIPSIFGLFSYDVFLYSLLFNFLYFIYLIVFEYKKGLISIFIANLLLLFVFQLLSSFVISGSLDYINYSLDTVTEYSYLMRSPWNFNQIYLLIFPFFTGLFILLKRKFFPKENLLLALAISAGVQFNAALTRSDAGHIMMGIYPSIIFLFIAIFKFLKNKNYSYLFLFLFFLLPHRFVLGEVSLTNFKYFFRGIRDKYDFNDLYVLPNNYHFSQGDLNDISLLIQENPGKVWVYPYENFLLNISDDTFNSFGLQAYEYSGSKVEQKTVEMFQQKPPQFIIFGIDDSSATKIDDMANATRNPLLFAWILQNYEIKQKNDKYFILNFNPKKIVIDNRNECSLFFIEVPKLKFKFLDEIVFKIKKPAYFLSFNGFDEYRVPIANLKSDQKIFFIENYNEPLFLEKLFEQYGVFEKKSSEKIDGKISIGIIGSKKIATKNVFLEKICY